MVFPNDGQQTALSQPPFPRPDPDPVTSALGVRPPGGSRLRTRHASSAGGPSRCRDVLGLYATDLRPPLVRRSDPREPSGARRPSRRDARQIQQALERGARLPALSQREQQVGAAGRRDPQQGDRGGRQGDPPRHHPHPIGAGARQFAFAVTTAAIIADQRAGFVPRRICRARTSVAGGAMRDAFTGLPDA
jgi:hypothetical protein